MKKLYDISDLRKTIKDSKEDLTTLLRSIGHVKRIEILSMLLDGEKEFSYFLARLELSKTALAKHLALLVENGLIEKIERGLYIISVDGEELFKSFVSSFKKSQLRFKVVQKKLWNKYLPKRINDEIKNNESFLVKNPARYEPGWLSFVSSISGVLKSLEIKNSLEDVAAYTGYAFFINIAIGLTDPSAPTYMLPINTLSKGISVFGWKISEYMESLPHSIEDLSIPKEKLDYFFEIVKKGIKRTKRPVIIWGIPIPEYGIVNGFKVDRYEVNTLRSHSQQFFGEDLPIKYDSIISPGRLRAFFFEKEIPKISQKDADIQAIKQALELCVINKNSSNYISGPEAFNEWAKTLEGNIEYISYHGNSYVAECILEAACYANTFLKKLNHRYISSHLIKAQEAYSNIENSLKKFEQLFPFAFDGDLNFDKRERGAKLLRSITPIAENAFRNLKLFLNNGI